MEPAAVAPSDDISKPNKEVEPAAVAPSVGGGSQHGGGDITEFNKIIETIDDKNLELKTTLNALIQTIPSNILNDALLTKIKSMVEIANKSTVIFKPTDELKQNIEKLNSEISEIIVEDTQKQTDSQLKIDETVNQDNNTTVENGSDGNVTVAQENNNTVENVTDGEKQEPIKEVEQVKEETTAPEMESSNESIKPTLESLKVSPLMTNASTNQQGKYIFVPIQMVDKILEVLLEGDCEVFTVSTK